MAASPKVSEVQVELEKLVSDLRGLLDNKSLDDLPEIKAVRKRIEDGVNAAQESAARVAQDATDQAKDAARATNEYAHEEPWRIAIAALAAGAVAGFLLGRR